LVWYTVTFLISSQMIIQDSNHPRYIFLRNFQLLADGVAVADLFFGWSPPLGVFNDMKKAQPPSSPLLFLIRLRGFVFSLPCFASFAESPFSEKFLFFLGLFPPNNDPVLVRVLGVPGGLNYLSLLSWGSGVHFPCHLQAGLVLSSSSSCFAIDDQSLAFPALYSGFPPLFRQVFLFVHMGGI